MNDGWVVNSPFMAALICYLYTWESLLKIEMDGPRFHFDVASEDGKILEEQWQKDELNVQVGSYIKTYVRIIGILKKLHREGRQSWVSESWVSGRGK